MPRADTLGVNAAIGPRPSCQEVYARPVRAHPLTRGTEVEPAADVVPFALLRMSGSRGGIQNRQERCAWVTSRAAGPNSTPGSEHRRRRSLQPEPAGSREGFKPDTPSEQQCGSWHHDPGATTGLLPPAHMQRPPPRARRTASLPAVAAWSLAHALRPVPR